jgi:ferrochelatase
MTISSVVDIVGGVLQNTPSISFITQIHTDYHKIKDGDMFISNNISHIKEAVSKGAFLIIYDDQHITILDNEIAWVKVDSVELALIKLARYHIDIKNIIGVYCDSISYEYLKLLSYSNCEILFLSGNIFEDFDLIINKTITTIYSKNKNYLNNIEPSYMTYLLEDIKIDNIMQHSIFKTSFRYKGRYFYKVNIPLVYIKYFLNAYDKKADYDFDLKKLANIPLFNPIFIDRGLNIVSFGESNKFILSNIDPYIYNIEIDYLKTKYHYGKIKIIDFINQEHLIEQIKQPNLNAIYIKGIYHLDIVDILEKFHLQNNTFNQRNILF